MIRRDSFRINCNTIDDPRIDYAKRCNVLYYDSTRCTVIENTTIVPRQPSSAVEHSPVSVLCHKKNIRTYTSSTIPADCLHPS